MNILCRKTARLTAICFCVSPLIWNAGAQDAFSVDPLRDRQLYHQKMQEIESYGRRLSVLQIDMIFEFLEKRDAAAEGLTRLNFLSLKNDMLEALINQQAMPETLGSRLLAMYADTTHDPLWRDYCIQHIPLYYERCWPRGAPADDALALALRESVWSATVETSETMAGSALIALERLSQGEARIDRARLRRRALAIAYSEQTSLQCRLCALRLCGHLNVTAARTLARRLALDEEEILSLRMAAVSVIGDIGAVDDAIWLRTLAEARTPLPIRRLIHGALEKVRK